MGTAAANLLQNYEQFIREVTNHVHNFKNLGYNEFDYYTSINFQNRYSKLAFGHLKYAIHASPNPDGSTHIVGQARDIYDFSKMQHYIGSAEHEFVSIINNMAYDFQKAGLLRPYVYAVQIDMTVW